ncbi:hypothetical protein [Marivita sp. S2033]|uniref:hypothetical protein n=1 Tax=Marivita sp. S2033 TaxID=3373187 RepID=UPI003982284F
MIAPDNVIERPVLTFPDEVGDWVRAHYQNATTILEYGSGGSTVLASEMSGKTIYSVESDAKWCAMMQSYLDANPGRSPVVMHHANIGKVGKWGRPKNDDEWARYHRYPNSVWDIDGFQAPDLVMVDGRFRAACLITAMLRTEKPLTLLFDDYVGRKSYARVEAFVKPAEIRDRMARFEIVPTELPKRDLTEILTLYTKSF